MFEIAAIITAIVTIAAYFASGKVAPAFAKPDDPPLQDAASWNGCWLPAFIVGGCAIGISIGALLLGMPHG